MNLLLISEPHRALEHLEEFHSTLISPEDDDLKVPVERLIKSFKSSLFGALVGVFYFIYCILYLCVIQSLKSDV